MSPARRIVAMLAREARRCRRVWIVGRNNGLDTYPLYTRFSAARDAYLRARVILSASA